MIRLELELSIPDNADAMGVAAIVATALLEPLGSRGAVVHRLTAEEADA